MLEGEPSYQAQKSFFFFGLVGPTHEISIDDVCLGKDADQVATRYTWDDFLSALFTLGLYTPRTVQVWCRL